MDVLRSLDDVTPAHRGAAIAIGNFDGVHRGHLAVISLACEKAREGGVPAGVMVFEPHPRAYFRPDETVFSLTPLPEKLRRLAEVGLDFVAVLAFDAELAALTPERFVTGVLVQGLGVSHVVVGYDFRFGKGAAGTPDDLKKYGAQHGFVVSVVDAAGEGKAAFSSSRIRAALSEGEVAAAARMLGHHWRIVGTVEHGAGRGKGLGFPTANIDLSPGQSLKPGIYAVWVEVDGARHDGAAYLGTRPTFDDGAQKLEVTLFGYDGDLYGREIAVEFVGFLRGDRAFDSAAALQAQMEADCEAARAVLAGAE